MPSNDNLNHRVEAELRAVLGRVPKLTAPKLFVADLNAAFNFREVEGHHEWEWNPRLNVGAGDFGGMRPIAQQTLADRAAEVGERVIPILDELEPLDEAADDEECEAYRAAARGAVSELVEELSRDGVVREDRVVQLFDVLGVTITLGKPDQPNPVASTATGTPFNDLAQTFGFIAPIVQPQDPVVFQYNRVATLEEERNLANFISAHDEVASLANAWIGFFDNRGRFFGTALFDLSRQLSSVAECVEHVSAALDAVGLSASRRELLFIEPPVVNPPPFTRISVGGYLDWTADFVATEAYSAVENAGKIGAGAIKDTLDRLKDIATAALAIDNDRFEEAVVQTAWKELESSLLAAAAAAGKANQ